jgi:hypothetical protein
MESLQKIRPQINHNTNTAPMMIPESFNIETLFPLAAILPNRLADPFKLVLIDEKVFDYAQVSPYPATETASPNAGSQTGGPWRGNTYSVINNILTLRIIININRHTPQCRDL